MSHQKLAKRRSIGNNPLDSMITSAEEKPRRPSSSEAESKPQPEKVRATYHLPADLIEEVKDAVVALSGPPVRLTLAAFAANAMRAEIERLKIEHNRGRAFPKREGELRGGRPIGS